MKPIGGVCRVLKPSYCLELTGIVLIWPLLFLTFNTNCNYKLVQN